MKSRIKMFLPLLIALFLISALLGISGCGGSDSGTNSSHNGASGSGVVYADAKSKSSIELTRVLKGIGSPNPKATVTIKNISSESIAIGSLKQWLTYSVQVISMDKNGRTLNNSYLTHSGLRPKEMYSEEIALFPSDETNGCQIIVSYKGLPEVTGTLNLSSAAASEFMVSHRMVIGDIYSWPGLLLLEVNVKNISSASIGNCYANKMETWDISVDFKDASGSIIANQTYNLVDANGSFVMRPGETKQFNFGRGGSWGNDIQYLETSKSYEITLIRRK